MSSQAPHDPSTSSQTPASTNKESGRKRRKVVRSRAGCLVCRKRRKACDMAKPQCGTCVRLKMVSGPKNPQRSVCLPSGLLLANWQASRDLTESCALRLLALWPSTCVLQQSSCRSGRWTDECQWALAELTCFPRHPSAHHLLVRTARSSRPVSAWGECRLCRSQQYFANPYTSGSGSEPCIEYRLDVLRHFLGPPSG
jgi:hypothetical protein